MIDKNKHQQRCNLLKSSIRAVESVMRIILSSQNWNTCHMRLWTMDAMAPPCHSLRVDGEGSTLSLRHFISLRGSPTPCHSEHMM